MAGVLYKDRLLIAQPEVMGLTREYITDFTDGLASALRPRGPAPMAYTQAHFRTHLPHFCSDLKPSS